MGLNFLVDTGMIVIFPEIEAMITRQWVGQLRINWLAPRKEKIMYKNFYPTPDHVISRMIEGIKNITSLSVLDPQAGTGAILDYISNLHGRYGRNTSSLHAVEINPEFRPTLTDKGYKVVGTDIFDYPGHQHFNLILSNPPFDEGARHLLRVWDISNGAIIRCLVNSETISNPYTSDRKQLALLIKEYGWVKDLGPVFKDAERTTRANVSLIHLQDTREREAFTAGFDPDTIDSSDFDLGNMDSRALASANIFDNYEARYDATIQAFKDLLVARAKVHHFLSPLVTDYPSPEKLVAEALKDGNSGAQSYDDFLGAVTKAGWDHLFRKTKMNAVTTEGVRKEVEAMQNAQGKMAFTAANMEDLFNLLFLNRENIFLQCVLEVFDELTKYYDSNRSYYTGWKTNTAYAVKARFILPNIGSPYSTDSIHYESVRKLSDIEKALCFLSGKRIGSIRSIESVYTAMKRAGGNYIGQWIESEFFDTKLFKNRNMHFRWCDEDLRVLFNTTVAKERWNMLPEKIKKGVFD